MVFLAVDPHECEDRAPDGVNGQHRRLFRRAALSGQSCANDREIDQATTVATAQLNRRAKPWVWGRPPKPHRHLRRLLVYRI